MRHRDMTAYLHGARSRALVALLGWVLAGVGSAEAQSDALPGGPSGPDPSLALSPEPTLEPSPGPASVIPVVGVPEALILRIDGVPGWVHAVWGQHVILGAGNPERFADLATGTSRRLVAEGAWRPSWAAPIPGGWLQLDLWSRDWPRPDASGPRWWGRIRWRLVRHRGVHQHLLATGTSRRTHALEAFGWPGGWAFPPRVATDGEVVATWEEVGAPRAQTWQIVTRSVRTGTVLSRLPVGYILGLGVGQTGVTWTDLRRDGDTFEERILWAPPGPGRTRVLRTTAFGGDGWTRIRELRLAGGGRLWRVVWQEQRQIVDAPGQELDELALWSADTRAGSDGSPRLLTAPGQTTVDAATDRGYAAWIDAPVTGARAGTKRLMVDPPDMREPFEIVLDPARGYDAVAMGGGWLAVKISSDTERTGTVVAVPLSALSPTVP